MALRTPDKKEMEGHENPIIPEIDGSDSPITDADLDNHNRDIGDIRSLPEADPDNANSYSPTEENHNFDLPHPGSELSQAEKKGGVPDKGVIPGLEGKLNKGFTDDRKNQGGEVLDRLAGKSLTKILGSKRVKYGGAGAGAIVTIVILLITALAPVLRLDHILANIDNRAYAGAENAMQIRLEHLFERYTILKILNLKTCKAVVSSECRADYSKQGLAASMFNAWRDKRAEDKIFAELGLSIESTKNPDRVAGRHSLTLKDKNGKKFTFADENDWKKFTEGEFKGGRREFGQNLRKALKDSTLDLNVYQRKALRSAVARKHGVKFWCFLACKQKDAVEENIKDSKTKLKYRFIKRFVYPFSGKYSLILNCIVDGNIGSDKCSPTKLREQNLDGTDLSDEDLKSIEESLKKADASGGLRLSDVVLERLLSKVLSKEATKATLSSIPIAGQIYLGLVIADLLDQADQFVDNNGFSKVAADINASQYVEYYTGIRADNDALKKGELSISDLGALASDFNGAEDSLVYKARSGKPAKESPVSKGESPYLCSDGKPIPEGDYVCEEKKVARQYDIEAFRDGTLVSGAADLLNPLNKCVGATIPFTDKCAGVRVRFFVHNLVGAVDLAAETIFGPAATAAVAVVKAIPGVGGLIKLVLEKFKDLVFAIFGKVFPLPLQSDSPARDKYDGLEAGASIVSKDFAQGGYSDDGDFGLGAPKSDGQKSAAAFREYTEQKSFELAHSSLYQRIANIDNPDSLIGKTSMHIPISFSDLVFGVVSAPVNFMKNLPAQFGVFSRAVHAASTQSLAEQQAAIDPFGIGFSLWSSDDPALTADPGTLTPEKCEAIKQYRISHETENKVTGFIEYTGSDPCLLESVVVDSGCAIYVDGDSCEKGSESTSSDVSGSAAELAQQLLDLIKGGQVGLLSPGHTEVPLEEAADGKCSHTELGTCVKIDVRVLKSLVVAANQHKFSINSLTTGHASNPPSKHNFGLAVDVSSEATWFAKIAADNGANIAGGTCKDQDSRLTNEYSSPNNHCHVQWP